MTVSDFYPRPHMEGDGAGKKQIRAGKDFYPRPHMEGDLADLPPMVDFKAISTHALTWRATIYLRVPDIEGIGFLPTPSHGGRPKGSVFALPLSNFYPRPHMEGDPFKFLSVDYLRVISTHALTWRATNNSGRDLFDHKISTHALTWRATMWYNGGDNKNGISTHALTWRATGFGCPN